MIVLVIFVLPESENQLPLEAEDISQLEPDQSKGIIESEPEPELG